MRNGQITDRFGRPVGAITSGCLQDDRSAQFQLSALSRSLICAGG